MHTCQVSSVKKSRTQEVQVSILNEGKLFEECICCEFRKKLLLRDFERNHHPRSLPPPPNNEVAPLGLKVVLRITKPPNFHFLVRVGGLVVVSDSQIGVHGWEGVCRVLKAEKYSAISFGFHV